MTGIDLQKSRMITWHDPAPTASSGCSAMTELSERWVAQCFPALFFADDRGREGA
jgi:hypothetical protein